MKWLLTLEEMADRCRLTSVGPVSWSAKNKTKERSEFVLNLGILVLIHAPAPNGLFLSLIVSQYLENKYTEPVIDV